MLRSPLSAISTLCPLFYIHHTSQHSTHFPESMLQRPCSTASAHLMCTRPFSHTHSVLYHSLLRSLSAALCKTPFTLFVSALFYCILALLPPHRTYFPYSIFHASHFPCHFLFLKLYFMGCTHHSLKLTLPSPHPCHTTCYNLFSSLSVTRSLPVTVPYSLNSMCHTSLSHRPLPHFICSHSALPYPPLACLLCPDFILCTGFPVTASLRHVVSHMPTLLVPTLFPCSEFCSHALSFDVQALFFVTDSILHVTILLIYCTADMHRSCCTRRIAHFTAGPPGAPFIPHSLQSTLHVHSQTSTPHNAGSFTVTFSLCPFT